jgi:hypothetical protein
MYEKVRSEALHAESAPGAKHRVNPKAAGMLSENAPVYRPRAAGFFRQIAILIMRYFKVLVRDYRNIGLVLAQSPLIALLLGLVFDTNADFLPLSFYFCVTISAIWMGGINSIREIAREWEFFEREYRVGLRATAFASSKIAVQCTLAFVQAFLFCIFLRGIFNAFTLDAAMLALTSAACISGALLGLLVSAFSGNVNRAISWLPIMFIPQIFLSGILIPFDRMPAAGRALSHLTLSRPVFSLFKKACLLDLELWTLTEWRALALLDIVLIILMFIRVRWYYLFARERR